MLHQDRVWTLTACAHAEQLAAKLKHHTWTLCTGFSYRGILWLNDSTSEDAVQEYAVQEYAVVRLSSLKQIESITVSWCEEKQLIVYINDFALSLDAPNEVYGVIRQTQLEHGTETCELCQ